jgi:hypothetical protein
MELVSTARSATRCLSAAFANLVPLSDFSWRSGSMKRPPYRQKHVEDKQCDGDVVEQCRLAQGWFAAQKRKAEARIIVLITSDLTGLAVRQGNQGERKRGEEIMRLSGKEARKYVPQKQHSNSTRRHEAQDYGQGTVNRIDIDEASGQSAFCEWRPLSIER